MANNKNVIEKELKKSPLFNISLSSKELFHSNFWAWLIEIEINEKNPFVEVFYPDFYYKGNYSITVKREENHIDIMIKYKNKCGEEECFLIENKIKSLPTIEQLNNYKAKTEKTFSFGILTGIVNTLDECLSTQKDWRFKSYEDISSDIRRINDNNKSLLTEYQYTLINNYCDDINNISNLIKHECQVNNCKYIIKPNIDSELRFNDILLKFNASEFSKYIEREIYKSKQELESNFGVPSVENGFRNKKSIITIVYKQPINALVEEREKKEAGRIGVQIEGNQFRIYAGPSYKESKYFDLEKLKREFTEIGWFENYSDKKIRGEESAMRDDYCKYRKDYLHMYQYFIIEDTNFESLYKRIKRELLRAKALIDQGKISF